MDRHPNDLTTDEEIDAAIERARLEPEGPRIVEAKYHPERGLDLFVLTISDGRRLVLPREELQFVADATRNKRQTSRLGLMDTTSGGRSWIKVFVRKGCSKDGAGIRSGWSGCNSELWRLSSLFSGFVAS